MQISPIPIFSTLCRYPALCDHYKEAISWAHQALQKRRDADHILLHVILSLPTAQKQFAGMMIGCQAESLAISPDGAKCAANPQTFQQTAVAIQNMQAQDTRSLRESEQELLSWIESEIYGMIAYGSVIDSSGYTESPLKLAQERDSVLKAIPPLAEDEESLVSIFGSSKIELGIRVPLNIPPMDQYVLQGGVPRKSTVLLTGASNVGKSRIGLHGLVRSAILGETVVLASGEDSWQMTRARAFATLLGTTQESVMAMDEAERAYALDQRLEILETQFQSPGLADHIRKGFLMKRFKNGTMTPQGLQDILKKASDLTGKATSMAMIDYLQCATPNGGPRRGEQTDQQLERFVREVEDVSVEEDTISMIITQSKAAQVGKSKADLVNTSARSYAAIQAAQYVLTILQAEEEMQRRIETGDFTAALDLVLCKAKDTGLGACYALSNPETSSYRFFRTREERDLVARQECRQALGARSGAAFNPLSITSSAGG